MIPSLKKKNNKEKNNTWQMINMGSLCECFCPLINVLCMGMPHAITADDPFFFFFLVHSSLEEPQRSISVLFFLGKYIRRGILKITIECNLPLHTTKHWVPSYLNYIIWIPQNRNLGWKLRWSLATNRTLSW